MLANRAVDPFFAQVAPDLLRPPVNLVRLGLDPRGFARMVVNLADVRAVFRARISRQLAVAPDPELTALYDELLATAPEDASSQRIDTDVVIPMILRVGGRELRLFSTITADGRHDRRDRDRVLLSGGCGKRRLLRGSAPSRG
ncbi:hypothetical protein GA0070558_1453 [Micromonospora haikouensis]|uniref:MmyB-like transcription regulator ligand binding domain-containing protein n=1 Tax=Micromonospora haikouensis TaxID=686309 RepID=A0A1C4YFP8_9ACTN|nr:hypothetical protein [Micromonospora haikouensis]SCF19534.1 hypothetical protein GA0070558_1453 [Micromonospora haikouensis]